MSLNRNTNIPRDLKDCIFMLRTLNAIEGKRLDNRGKLEGCIRFLEAIQAVRNAIKAEREAS